MRFPIASLGPIAAALSLAGCATLPANGPTAHDIARRAEASGAPIQFQIVPLGAADVSRLNARSDADTASSALPPGREVGLIGPGDVLQISLFEVGVSLFGRNATSSSGLFDPSAHGEKLPLIVVQQDGSIQVPYAGTIQAGGLTPDALARLIQRRYVGQSQSPQVIVSIDNNVANVVYVTGAVHKPGRLDLTVDQERLLDAIARSGGSTLAPEDSVVRIVRGTFSEEERLSDIAATGQDDVILSPGDRIEILSRPRSFLAFGAAGRVSQIAFDTNRLSLAEAIAKASGPSDILADPTAIFLFRDDPAASKDGAKPVVYRINMMEPSTYLLAQRFHMHDKDVLYFANARANRPSKLIALINQLFSPFVLVRAATQ